MIFSAHQLHYLPSVRYFSRIARSDAFVAFDTVQFVKGDWINRNRILLPNGPLMLTLPIKGKKQVPIRNVDFDRAVVNFHWKAILHTYARSPGIDALKEIERDTRKYIDYPFNSFAVSVLKIILGKIGIETHVQLSGSTYVSSEGTDAVQHQLNALCKLKGCTKFLVGDSAFEYLKREIFEGIEIVKDTWPCPPYPQCTFSGSFVPELSIIDLIANMPNWDAVRNYLRG